MLIGKEQAFERLQKAVSQGGADALEATLFGDETNLTRFANSYIHQNIGKQDAGVTIRAIVDGSKIGTVNTNDLSDEGLAKAVAGAIEAAKLVPKNDRFPGLPGKQEYPEVESWSQETYEAEPMFRAKEVAKIIATSDEHGFDASGAYTTGATEIAIVNSVGMAAYRRLTKASVNITILSDTSAGFAAEASKDVRELDAAALGKHATQKAFEGQNPTAIPPEEYDIVVEPHGVADLLTSMGYSGFNGLAYHEQRSFATGKLGEKLFGENFTLIDDAHDPTGSPAPFDFEGMPKQRVPLVENGVVKNVVFDRTTAKMEGVKTTGHGLPAGTNFGAIPMHLFMAGGDSSLEKMIAGTKRGLLITHFHYLNPFLQPLELLFTGMTRDGTFLIEDGKIVRPVMNLRFTESMLKAFNNIEALSKETILIDGNFTSVRVPAVKFKNFKFTS